MRVDATHKLNYLSLRQATALVERHLPWFRKARSKFFLCNHCECRRKDAELLNKSALPIHLIINESTKRNWTVENQYSVARKNRKEASTLHPDQWLPQADELDLMIQLSGISEEEAKEIRSAHKRLQNTQLHYNNILFTMVA